MTFTRTWSDAYEATPAGSEGLATADDYIRATRVDVRETFEINHVEMDAAGRGEHTKVTFNAPIATPSNVANKGFVYTKDVAAKAELHFEDEDGNEIQITSGGVLKLPATAASLAGEETFTGAKTFSADITLDGGNIVCAATETVDGRDVSADGAAVDDHETRITTLEAVPGFGAWDATKVANTVYQASTDGIVIALTKAEDEGVLGYTDGSNPPTTCRAKVRDTAYPGTHMSLIMPVRKDDYWKVTDEDGDGADVGAIYWLPVGA